MIEEHTQVWTSRKTQQLDVLLTDLRAQLGRMEKAWDDMRDEVDEGPVYQEAGRKFLAAESSMNDFSQKIILRIFNKFKKK